MNYVNAFGEPITIGSRNSHIQTRNVTKKDAAIEYHKGWRVQGHPPGSMEQAKTEALRLLSIWDSQSEQEKIDALRGGERKPTEWDEAKWRRETRKKPVRQKAYEIPDAANQCADMARQAGWLDVEVAELKKSKVA